LYERGAEEPLPEVNKMAERPATPKQLVYIERLAADYHMNVDKPLEELTMKEASKIIDELLKKANDQAGPGGQKRVNNWSNGARIGLAFKVCYLKWVGSGVNIFANKEQFVKNVVDTYQLLNEIAEKAEAA
jgi:hypothetical protein